MSKDYRHCRGGLPDLVVWNTSNNTYKVRSHHILAVWIRYFPLCMDSDAGWHLIISCLITWIMLQLGLWHGLSCCCSWWRWRGPMTGYPRSNRSGWMSCRNWGLMWRCVTWRLLEPEDLVWNKQTQKKWLLRFYCYLIRVWSNWKHQQKDSLKKHELGAFSDSGSLDEMLMFNSKTSIYLPHTTNLILFSL